MGNRAIISLKSKNQNEFTSYYVHWNGGRDTLGPLIEAIKIVSKKMSIVPTLDIIERVFFKFSDQKMQKIETGYKKNYLEENGHYILDMAENVFVHLNEVDVPELKKLIDYGLNTEVRTTIIHDGIDYAKNYILEHYREEYKEAALKELPERLKSFEELLSEELKPLVELKELKNKKDAIDAKKTFKKLILDDLKELKETAIIKKIKSIRSTYSSVNVDAVDLLKDERERLENILNRYKAGYFDGMTDSYVYSKNEDNKAAKTVRYVFLNNEFSDNFKETVKNELIKDYQKSIEDIALDIGIDHHTLLWRKCCEIKAS